MGHPKKIASRAKEPKNSFLDPSYLDVGKYSCMKLSNQHVFKICDFASCLRRAKQAMEIKELTMIKKIQQMINIETWAEIWSIWHWWGSTSTSRKLPRILGEKMRKMVGNVSGKRACWFLESLMILASRSLTCWHSSLACWHLRAGTCFNACLICFLQTSFHTVIMTWNAFRKLWQMHWRQWPHLWEMKRMHFSEKKKRIGDVETYPGLKTERMHFFSVRKSSSANGASEAAWTTSA